MSDITFRKAVPDDAEAVGSVHFRAWIETYTGLINEEYLSKLSAERSAGIFRRTACKDLVVAVADGEIVGYCAYSASRDADAENCGEIQGIYVLNAYQRMGIGGELLKLTQDALRANGYTSMSLWVLDSNVNAIAFYERSGLKFDGTEKTAIIVTPITEKRYVCAL